MAEKAERAEKNGQRDSAGGGQYSGGGTSGHKGPKCHKCGKFGHIQKNCPNKRAVHDFEGEAGNEDEHDDTGDGECDGLFLNAFEKSLCAVTTGRVFKAGVDSCAAVSVLPSSGPSSLPEIPKVNDNSKSDLLYSESRAD